MNLIPPNFDPLGILDPHAREAMADWWEEHGDHRRAECLRIQVIFCRFKGGPKHGKVKLLEMEFALVDCVVEDHPQTAEDIAANVVRIAVYRSGWQPRITPRWAKAKDANFRRIACQVEIDNEGILTLHYFQGGE